MAQRTNTSGGASRTALASISAALVATVAVVAACTTSAPTPTATPTPQPAPTATQEHTATATTEPTSTPAPTATATTTPTATATATPSPTRTPSPTPTATQTPLPTPTATATATPTPTPSPMPTLTPTPVPTPTQTPTPAPTPTPTPSPTPTATPIPLPSIEEQRATLAAFYAATRGDNWTNNDGWLSDLPLGRWHGITTDGRGNVTGLWLDANNLSGAIPAEIGTLASLNILYLSDNQLAGDIPHELWELTSLTSLYLSSNKLTGTVPPEIGNLTLLQSIGLGWNDISGTIPKEIWQLTALTQLDLQSNNLTGTVPPEIGNLMQLNFLGLASNELTGMIPDEIGRLTVLEWVYVSGNRFEGCVPDPLRLVRNNDSHKLNLLYCGFNPSDPDDRAILVKLYNATDGDNWNNNEDWLSDQPLAAWHGVEVDADGKVTRLDLLANNLNGTLIPELGQLDRLELLALSRNQLSGPIPPEYANLIHLRYLYLADNHLTGEFLGWSGDLLVLFLQFNQLTGDISKYADDLAGVANFSFAGNNFTGCLPENLRDFHDPDLVYSTHYYCNEPPKPPQPPPVTPEFIKWEIGDAVRPAEERAARLGVQWLFEYAESIGWPIVEEEVYVHYMTLEHLAYAASIEDGTIDEGELERERERISGIGGFARGPANFSRATEVGEPLSGNSLRHATEMLIHENIHTAFQHNLYGLYPDNRGYAVHPPEWFSEGMAEYFSNLIISLQTGETDVMRHRGGTINGVPVTEIPMPFAQDGFCKYLCGALAIELLASIVGQRHIVDFYTLQRLDRTWQETFEDVYGISVPDFYALYEQHRIAGFPELNPPIVPETGR